MSHDAGILDAGVILPALQRRCAGSGPRIQTARVLQIASSASVQTRIFHATRRTGSTSRLQGALEASRRRASRACKPILLCDRQERTVSCDLHRSAEKIPMEGLMDFGQEQDGAEANFE